MTQNETLEIGIEEEYQLVDPESGALRSDCKRVMRAIEGDLESEIQHELHLNQIEMASPVCHTLDEARQCLMRVRQTLASAAQRTGAALVSAATNPLPLPVGDDLAPKRRYRSMTEKYQKIARDLYIFGCHVHVSMEDRDLGVRVMNRLRVRLPFLQALTANSPFWDGADTGYDSYRRELWVQWPMAGPPPHFDSAADYDAAVQRLVDATAIEDASNVYWDIRLPDKVPTIEFRAADAMTDVEETLGYAALVRAMVAAAIRDEHAGRGCTPIDDSVLKFALWHAARFGVHDDLIDPVKGLPVSMKDYAEETLQWLGLPGNLPDDDGEAERFVRQTIQRGNGAKRQRAALGHDIASHNGELTDEDARKVVTWAVEATLPKTSAAA